MKLDERWSVTTRALRILYQGFTDQIMVDQFLKNFRALKIETTVDQHHLLYVALGLTALQVVKDITTSFKAPEFPLDILAKPIVPADAVCDSPE